MPDFCLRPLTNNILAEEFVEQVLRISGSRKKQSAVDKIVAAEFEWRRYTTCPTLISPDFRHTTYRDDASRATLRNRIVSELIKFPRISDDSIKLGRGGSRPPSGPLQTKQVYYVIGLPASGKSSIANKIADRTSSFILDSDYAKRKLPEYNGQLCSATLVHEESDELIFSRPQANLLEYCVNSGYNIVIPKIGCDVANILKMNKALTDNGYMVYLILVEVDRRIAVQRAYNRFRQTGRYVPLSLIYDGYGHEPTLSYYRIKQRHFSDFAGYSQISTEGRVPQIQESVDMDFIKELFEEKKGEFICREEGPPAQIVVN